MTARLCDECGCIHEGAALKADDGRPISHCDSKPGPPNGRYWTTSVLHGFPVNSLPHRCVGCRRAWLEPGQDWCDCPNCRTNPFLTDEAA